MPSDENGRICWVNQKMSAIVICKTPLPLRLHAGQTGPSYLSLGVSQVCWDLSQIQTLCLLSSGSLYTTYHTLQNDWPKLKE